MILRQESVTRTRTAAGARGSDGRFTAGAATTLAHLANVQPLTPDVRQALPEGQRQSDGRLLITVTEYRLADQTTGTLGDTVTIDTKVFEAVSVERFRGTLPHYEVVVLLRQETP